MNRWIKVGREVRKDGERRKEGWKEKGWKGEREEGKKEKKEGIKENEIKLANKCTDE